MCCFIGLHKIWEMLYFQWQQNNLQEDKARRDGKRAGDYVGYPAGWISAYLERDKWVILPHRDVFWAESCKVIPYFLLLRSVSAQAVKINMFKFKVYIVMLFFPFVLIGGYVSLIFVFPFILPVLFSYFFADETSLEAGIRVQIHSQDEPPYIHQLGFGVSPGFQTFVSCQEQRV